MCVYSSLSFDGSLKVTHNVAIKEQLTWQVKLQYIYTPKMQAWFFFTVLNYLLFLINTVNSNLQYFKKEKGEIVSHWGFRVGFKGKARWAKLFRTLTTGDAKEIGGLKILFSGIVKLGKVKLFIWLFTRSFLFSLHSLVFSRTSNSHWK